ncbi:MAG TPA: carboxypeptidase-like regulatory domain-containing protein, partial [Clostridia bacterium]
YGDSKINVSGSAIIINDSAANWKLDGGYSVEVLKSKTGGTKTREVLVSRGYYSLGVVAKGPAIVYASPALGTQGVSRDVDCFKFSFSSALSTPSISENNFKLLRRLRQGESKVEGKNYMEFSDIPGDVYEVLDTNARLRTNNKTEVYILNKSDIYDSLLNDGDSYLFIVKIGTTGVTDEIGNPVDTKSSSGVARFLNYNGETPAFMGTAFSVSSGAVLPASIVQQVYDVGNDWKLVLAGQNLTSAVGVTGSVYNLSDVRMADIKPFFTEGNNISAYIPSDKRTLFSQGPYYIKLQLNGKPFGGIGMSGIEGKFSVNVTASPIISDPGTGSSSGAGGSGGSGVVVTPPELYLADNIVVPDVIPSVFNTRVNVFGKYFDNLPVNATSTSIYIKQTNPDTKWMLGFGTSQPLTLKADDKEPTTQWISGETNFSGIRLGSCEISAINTPLGADGSPAGNSEFSNVDIYTMVVRELGINVDKLNGIMAINNKDTSIESDFESFDKIKVQMASPSGPQDVAEYVYGDSRINISGPSIKIKDSSSGWLKDGVYIISVMKSKTGGGKTRNALLSRGYFSLGFAVKGPVITGVSPLLGENGVSRDVERFKFSFSSLMNSTSISGDKIMLLRRLNLGEIKDTSKKYMVFSDIPGAEYEVIDTAGRLNIGTTSDNRTEVSILNKYGTLASLLKPGDSYLFIVKIGTTGIADASGNPINTSSSGVARFFDYNGETPAYMGTAFTVKPLSVNAYPVNSAGGANTNFIFELQISKQIPSGGKIKVTLPAGFIVDGAVKDKASQRNFDLNGSKGDVITISDNVAVNPSEHSVTVTLQGKTGDSTDPNNDYLSFELSGIVNPSYDSSGLSNSYKAQITTLNADGSTIEGPLGTNGFNIEKSGTGSISVVVTDSTSSVRIGNVRVQLQSTATGTMKAVTNSSGFAIFQNLNFGHYIMSVEREQDVNGDSKIDYYAYSNPTGIDISDTNPTTGSIMRVISVERLGLKNIQVNVNGVPSGAAIDVFASSPGGYFTKRLSEGTAILQLPLGVGYMIGLSAADASSSKLFIPPAPQYYKVDGDLTGSSAINIKIVSTIRKLTGKVYVISTNSQKSGVLGANVWAYNPSGGTGASATTDADGSYTMYLADGAYSVGASVPGMPPVPSLNEVLSGFDKSDVNFDVRRLDKQIAVSIVNEDGITQKNVPIYANRIDKTGYINGFIDSSGSTSLFVSPGTYKVGGYIPGFGPVEYGSIVDTTSSDQNIQITFRQNTTSLVKGIFRNGLSILSGVSIWAEPCQAGYSGNNTITDPQGNYVLRLQGGTSSEPKTYKLHSFSQIAGQLDYPEIIRVVAGSDQIGVDFSSPVTGNLTVLFTR